MVRLSDIPTEATQSVIQDAFSLYEKDQALKAREQQRAELARAAEELGVPVEYLERAAIRYRERQARREQRLRWARGSGVFAIGAVVGLAVGLISARQAAEPATVVEVPAGPNQIVEWPRDPFPGQGGLFFGNDRIEIRIPRPGPQPWDDR